MSRDAYEVARKLARVQSRLRKELLEELQRHAEDIENVFDPYSYSPVVHEIKEKYLSRLYVLQALIQELAHLNQSRRNPPVKVTSIKAEDSEALVERVNEKLANLDGAKILDVKFIQNKTDEDWVALISFIGNPFTEAKDETAAWM